MQAGLHQGEHSQQIEGGDPSPLLRVVETQQNAVFSSGLYSTRDTDILGKIEQRAPRKD